MMEDITNVKQVEVKKFKRFILICEGGPHTIEYMINNGVIPNSIILDTSKFNEILPYLSVEDDILLLIKGLTDFTLTDIYGLINVFKQNSSKLGRVTILSNINLGKVDLDYYFYTGDLFYGSVYKVVNGKRIVINDEDKGRETKTEEKGLRGLFKKEKRTDKNQNKPDKFAKNAVANAYKVYNCKDVKVQIYSKDKKAVESPKSKDGVLERVKAINLYEN